MKIKINRESLAYKNALALAREDRKLREELIRRRLDLGLSQAGLADRIGYTLDFIQRFERYDYDPSLGEIRRYALGVGVVIKHEIDPVRNPTDDGQYQ